MTTPDPVGLRGALLAKRKNNPRPTQYTRGWNDAIDAAAALATPAPLDEAWAEAEAALPKGWAITMVWGTVTEDRWVASAAPWPTEQGTPFAIAGGDTPAAALRALAACLAAIEDFTPQDWLDIFDRTADRPELRAKVRARLATEEKP